MDLQKPQPPAPNASLGDAIDFIKQDPKGFVGALKKVGSFFVALFRRKK